MQKVKPVIIGITGSTGKSSVTSFILQFLSSKYVVAEGKLNTKLGLSVNFINNVQPNCDFFVAEMGMDGLGQIESITEMFPPHIAVLTTVNQTHAAKLGSVEEIARAKSEILINMDSQDTFVVNNDNKYTREIGSSFVGKVIWYGADDITHCAYDLSKFKPLGVHNRLNLIASIRVAEEVGMSYEEISQQVPKLHTPKGRLNRLAGINGCQLIDDTYNASPASTKAALDVLFYLPVKKRIAFLGDMLELGATEVADHRAIGEYLSKLPITAFIGVGPLMKLAVNVAKENGINSFHFGKSTDVDKAFLSQLGIDTDTAVLVKGSQGIRMEKITKLLLEDPSKAPLLLVRQDARWISQ